MSENSVRSESRQEAADINPWLNIWFQPKKTIRHIVNTNPEKHVLYLGAIAGIYRFIDQAVARNFGDTLSLLWILILAVGVGSILGIASLYFGGAVFGWTGSWFGGEAASLEVRAVIAWSSIIDIAGLITFVPVVLIYGRNWFQSSIDLMSSLLGLLIFFYILVTGIILIIWKAVIFISGLAEVHNFSIWKSLISTVLGFVVIAVPLFCILFIVT